MLGKLGEFFEELGISEVYIPLLVWQSLDNPDKENAFKLKGLDLPWSTIYSREGIRLVLEKTLSVLPGAQALVFKGDGVAFIHYPAKDVHVFKLNSNDRVQIVKQRLLEGIDFLPYFPQSAMADAMKLLGIKKMFVAKKLFFSGKVELEDFSKFKNRQGLIFDLLKGAECLNEAGELMPDYFLKWSTFYKQLPIYGIKEKMATRIFDVLRKAETEESNSLRTPYTQIENNKEFSRLVKELSGKEDFKRDEILRAFRVAFFGTNLEIALFLADQDGDAYLYSENCFRPQVLGWFDLFKGIA